MERRSKKRNRIGERMDKATKYCRHLPVEIMEEEILCKLPVKSLLRFKCVSKTWRSLISSKGFMREHLNQSNSGTDFAHHNLFVTYSSKTREGVPHADTMGSYRIGSSLLNDDDDDDDDEEPPPNSTCLPSSNLSINSSKPVFHIIIHASCNGLILVTINKKELYLWNPSTRKAKNILQYSPSPLQTSTWKGRSWSGCGLGYDKSTDDYKVVCFLKQDMYMYSSRTGSWKEFQDFDQGLYLVFNRATFFNGKLHWLISRFKDHYDTSKGRSWYIVSLDLVEREKYQLVARPQYCFSDYSHCTLRTNLTVLGGYFSLICSDTLRTIDVWVMKEEYWSKIWAFSDPDPIGRSFKSPIWLKKNGDVVFILESDIIIYRGKDKLRQFQVVPDSRVQSIIYVESLVSPFSDDEQLRQ